MKTLFSIVLLSLGAASAQQEVTLDFAAIVGDQEVACGVMYEGVGAADSTVEFQDMRFYVSDIRLVTAQGEEVRLELAPNPWQHQNVALLDFENGTARCAESGNEATNSAVTGSVPAGDYSGVVFTLGVPFDLNHADVATAPSPLNISSMWWSWQGGYKHARIDLMSHSAAGMAMNEQNNNASESGDPSGGGGHAQGEHGGGHEGHGGAAQAGLWPIHIGSTGCDSSASVIPPATPCANPNVAEVRLENVDLEKDTVIADVSGLLEGVDVSQSLEMAPPGCMSGGEDPDCSALFANLSLSPGATQTFFRISSQDVARAE